MQTALVITSSTRPARTVRNARGGRVLPLRVITNSMVAGDELFDAVVFLGEALELPALRPGYDEWAGEVTAEFSPHFALRSLLPADPDESSGDRSMMPVRRAA